MKHEDSYFVIARETERELAESVRVASISHARTLGHLIIDGESKLFIQLMKLEEKANV